MTGLSVAQAAERVGLKMRGMHKIIQRGDIPSTRSPSYPHAFTVQAADVDEWFRTYTPGRSKVPLRLRGDHVAQVRELTEAMPSGCIEFRGCISSSTGYGQVGRNIPAHRVAWEAVNGPIPAGLHIDHLCRNHACVNPDHLEPVTIAENVLRGESPMARAARATHCPRGHEYSAANQYTRPGSDGKRRECYPCRRINQEVHNKKAKLLRGPTRSEIIARKFAEFYPANTHLSPREIAAALGIGRTTASRHIAQYRAAELRPAA